MKNRLVVEHAFLFKFWIGNNCVAYVCLGGVIVQRVSVLHICDLGLDSCC